MRHNTPWSYGPSASQPLLRTAVIFFMFFAGADGMVPETQAQAVLPQEALVDLVKPSIVRIAEHVSGTAKIPEIKVDIRKRLVAVVPDAYAEVPVDEYLVGSGFIIHPDGYIATNAHVVSQETVKQSLASESALSALYENALFLSDTEMQEFFKAETDNSFSKKVLQYVIEHSVFELKSEVAILRPDSEKRTMPDLLAEGFPATVVSMNDSFLEDERDVALLKIAETGLPALSLGDGDGLAVGKKAFIMGFPATAELNQNSSLEVTFTQGVVSAIKQSANRDFRIFQTDAKVSEGSSGGPLLDERGDVVGIVTFQTDELSRVQGDNFAFALPI
ncbi:MAG: serine protease, partial [Candidatus Moraniibacteriota bacterium]